MKKCALVLSLAVTALAIGVRPAAAQLGGITGALKKAQTVKKVADLKVTDAEERQIGQQVSDKMVETFGVYQDANVTKYVTLVGAVMALQSPRPGLDWQFVVLDTEGVNAFAAPGGFVHITKGLLGLMKNEAELAGVLAHEIIHVTEKHTVNAIQQGDAISLTSDSVGAAGGMTQSLIADFAQRAYSNILNGKFSRKDENEADDKGVQLANKVGYAPSGLAARSTKLTDRNKDAKEPNGLFASHPTMKDRLANIDADHSEKKLTRPQRLRRATPRTSPSMPSQPARWRRLPKGPAASPVVGVRRRPKRSRPLRRKRRRKRSRAAAACSTSFGPVAARRPSSRRRSRRPAREGSTPTAMPLAVPTRSACP